MNNYKPLTSCLCCDGNRLNKILDLENQPLANSYLKSKNDSEEFFPLGVNFCQDCTHLQLTDAVDPDLLFKNYLYVSGTTKTLKKYFDNFVNLTLDYFGDTPVSSILDIACNDGSQLDSFKNTGYKTYGIDPAENLHSLSSKNHEVVCDYFTEESVSRLSEQYFDVIIAQNVFAHNTYIKEFLDVCKNHLSDTGKIFIQTSQADMIKFGQFDTIYHEHISFFNIKSMATLVKRVGLYLVDVLKTDIHGTSYVFVISNDKNKDKTDYLISTEKTQDLEDVTNFARIAKEIVLKLKTAIDQFKAHGYTVIGYGAAAKGNTLLNFGKIDLDYIVDDNPLKQNLYTPGRKIQIISLEQVSQLVETPIVWVPLSWNFFKEIKSKIKERRPSDSIFISYFPTVKISIEE